MNTTTTRLRTLGLAVALGATSLTGARAAIDTQYDASDLLLHGLKKSGTAWVGDSVTFSLGSTWNVFRRAATPGDPTYGTVINLGNINSILTSTYGEDWTSLTADTLYFGAVGQNGSTSGISTATSSGDYARTVYVTSPRAGVGIVGESNSTPRQINTSSASSIAARIATVNSGAVGGTNPFAESISGNGLADNNALTPGGNPTTAYNGIQGGVVGAASSSTYNYASINNVVLGLDLYRVTPVLNASGWQNINSITADYGGDASPATGYGYYLGTITLSSNGDVNFAATAIPEPGTVAAAVLLAAGAWLRWRKRPQVTA